MITFVRSKLVTWFVGEPFKGMLLPTLTPNSFATSSPFFHLLGEDALFFGDLKAAEFLVLFLGLGGAATDAADAADAADADVG